MQKQKLFKSPIKKSFLTLHNREPKNIKANIASQTAQINTALDSLQALLATMNSSGRRLAIPIIEQL